MRIIPEIKPLDVPDYVLVNMKNDSDYIKVPLSNLDEEEIESLLTDFINEFCTKAGVRSNNGIISVELDE